MTGKLRFDENHVIWVFINPEDISQAALVLIDEADGSMIQYTVTLEEQV